jgi:hypothetical protein
MPVVWKKCLLTAYLFYQFNKIYFKTSLTLLPVPVMLVFSIEVSGIWGREFI